eukprot:281901-Prorocentrum_minimum.AAC.2
MNLRVFHRRARVFTHRTPALEDPSERHLSRLTLRDLRISDPSQRPAGQKLLLWSRLAHCAGWTGNFRKL